MQPNISYIICATPRSGSSLLCEALTNTGVAGQPEEYFGVDEQIVWEKICDVGRTTLGGDQLEEPHKNELTISGLHQLVRLYYWDASRVKEYFAAFVKQGTMPNGVYGVKMMWTHFDRLASTMRQLPAYKGLSVADCMKAVFPNLHYIRIKRYDKVRQAVSHAKALQTDIWEVTVDSPLRPVSKPVFSFQLIDCIACKLEAQEAAWDRYFMKHNIQPFVVIYEDLVSNYEKTALQILKELGIPTEQVTFGPRRLKQQADEESEQWVQHYYYLKTHSKWCRWVSHIDRLVVPCLLTCLGSAKLRAAVTKIYLKLMAWFK